MIPNPQAVVDRLIEFQKTVRDTLIAARSKQALHEVSHDTAADTIYKIDTEVEPILEDFCREWSKSTPLVLIAEGLEDEHGNETAKVFPEGTKESDAQLRVIVDPIDGTRGIMYDKRPAWALAGVAPNKGPGTRLRDIEVAVMSELPTSKMGFSDVLWAIKAQGARGQRVDLRTGAAADLPIGASKATTLKHGFASVVNFFPGTKVLASELMEQIVAKLLGGADVTKALVFDDQYISTGGQFYELINGHDRFNADLRPLFYAMQEQPEGLCCHPYDCATLLIAEEAGVILTNGRGAPLDGPMDCTTGLTWAGYANDTLRKEIEPVINAFLAARAK
jgi:fructose-1,6-bisphosphatase/inositol monophosphatase family enzyme